MRLDGFGLFVEDMAKMIRFYRDVLGFEIKEAEDTSKGRAQPRARSANMSWSWLRTKSQFKHMVRQRFVMRWAAR